MREILLVAILYFLTSSLQLLAQGIIPENLDTELRNYLIEMEEAPSSDYKGSFYLINIFDDSQFVEKKWGIYKFGMMGAHSRPFLYIYKEDSAFIVRDYRLSNVLKEVSIFLEYSELKQSDQILFLENLLTILRVNQSPLGSTRIGDDFK